MMPPAPTAMLRPPVQAYVVGPYTFRQEGARWAWTYHGPDVRHAETRDHETLEEAMQAAAWWRQAQRGTTPSCAPAWATVEIEEGQLGVLRWAVIISRPGAIINRSLWARCATQLEALAEKAAAIAYLKRRHEHP